MPSAATYFTAAQIGKALGRNADSVRRSLAAVAPPDGCIIVAGRASAAWSLERMPQDVRSELLNIAANRGYKDVPALLSAPPEIWQSPVPLAEVAPAAIERASKLQRALAPALARLNDPDITSARLEQIAVEGYLIEFGHSISTRAMRDNIKRVVDRDNGALNFARLEIYLPDNPPRKSDPPMAGPVGAEIQFADLHGVISSVANPASPSLGEKKLIWFAAFRAHDEQVAQSGDASAVKRALLEFLTCNAPCLVSANSADSANAMRVSFQRKYERWQKEGVKGLADARAERSGYFRAPQISQADRDLIIAHAAFNCGGRVAQCFRELYRDRKLSEALTGYYSSNPASKSYVPRKIVEQVSHEVRMQEDLVRGPRRQKLNGPHIDRDYSQVFSQEVWQGDDFTFPIYYNALRPDGSRVFTRGQTLLMCDARSQKVLGFCLIPEKHYNANAIRTLITVCADEHGIPKRGFYFENGTWKARVLRGSREDADLQRLHLGLSEFGFEFMHARLPRAKIVERIGGAIQNLMEGLAGYCGRNEITDKFERQQKLLSRAMRGDAQAQAEFFTHDEWCEILERLIHAFNSDVQNGKMIGGFSPDEAYVKFSDPSNPPTKFPAQLRYRLAHEKFKHRLASPEVGFTRQGESFRFYGPELSMHVGKSVLVWFNPDLPDMVTITDLDEQNPFTIARANSMKPWGEDEGRLSAELARCSEQLVYAKTRYKALKAIRPMPFREVFASREVIETGAEIERQQAELAQEQRQGELTNRRARNAAETLNMQPLVDNADPRQAAALMRLKKTLALTEEGEQ